MREILSWPACTLIAVVLLGGCSRREESAAGATEKADEPHIQPGAIGRESENWGYLGLRITKVHENQKALEQVPWCADGGDWTFLECALVKEPSVTVLIGTRTKGSTRREIPFRWGEAFLAVNGSSAGSRFVQRFARAFQVQAPPSHGNKPPGFLKINIAVLGDKVVRAPTGGFKPGPAGAWTATKWFLQTESAEAEVFFNYSIADGRAEFSEKDADYREDLIQQLVIGLRDGPLPERTPENDPNLTLVGPKVVQWTRIGDAATNETCQFGPGGDSIAVTVLEAGAHSKVFVAPTARPSERKLWAAFEGSAFVRDGLLLEQGLTLFVVESMRKDSKTISTADPQKLWLVNAESKREIVIPGSLTNWFATKGCVSPDGNFVALHSWRTQPKNKRSRILHLVNLRSGEWRQIETTETILELAGWTGRISTGVVLAGEDFRKPELRKPYSLDPRTGRLAPLPSIPIEFAPGRKLSPEGKQFVEVIGKERFMITQLDTGQRREFMVHPYDRSSVYPEGVHWGNERYLVFQAARTALINADTLKMSFVTEKDSGITSVEFSPGFKYALAIKDDGHYLGLVQAP